MKNDKAEQQECNHCGGTGDVSGEYPGVACPECSGSGVQVKPEFFTHSVEQPYDWSDWVCPDPKSYLMKCCDCGLVHEAQFGVVRYKSETEREDCDMVDDPNLQAVFRMRRSEQWSPKDMAYRPGGLPLAEQPAQQEPVAWVYPEGLEALKNGKPWTAYGTKQEANNIALYLHPTPEREPYAWVTFTPYGDEDDVWYENPEGKLLEGWTYKPLYDATPLQSTWVDLTEAEIDEICLGDEAKVRTALQLLKEKNT